jgi:hypothetical protein
MVGKFAFDRAERRQNLVEQRLVDDEAIGAAVYDRIGGVRTAGRNGRRVDRRSVAHLHVEQTRIVVDVVEHGDMGEGATVQLVLLFAAPDDEEPLVQGVGRGIRRRRADDRALRVERKLVGDGAGFRELAEICDKVADLAGLDPLDPVFVGPGVRRHPEGVVEGPVGEAPNVLCFAEHVGRFLVGHREVGAAEGYSPANADRSPHHGADPAAAAVLHFLRDVGERNALVG